MESTFQPTEMKSNYAFTSSYDFYTFANGTPVFLRFIQPGVL